MALTDRPDEKVCPRCPERGSQPASAFGANAARPDGIQSYCKPCNSDYQANHRRENPDAQPRWSKAWRERLREQMFEAYGRMCACCGESERTFLCLDHIDGLPVEHRDAHGARLPGDKILARLRREGWPAGYRILCANCNLAYAMLGTCPHQQRLKAVV